MAAHGPIAFAGDPWKPFSRENLLALGLSLPVQLTAGAAFGHPYDMRIFMTTDGWKDPSLSFPFRFYTQLGMLWVRVARFVAVSLEKPLITDRHEETLDGT